MPKKRKYDDVIFPSITLDLAAVMTKREIVDNFSSIDSILRDFLLTTYSPILAKLEKHYKDNPALTSESPELQEIADDIHNQLTSLGWSEREITKYMDISKDFGQSNSAMPSNFAFILQSIKNGKTVDEIINGYEYNGKHRLGLAARIEKQFVKDFERIKFCVIDEEDDFIITNDLNQEILHSLRGIAQ